VRALLLAHTAPRAFLACCAAPVALAACAKRCCTHRRIPTPYRYLPITPCLSKQAPWGLPAHCHYLCHTPPSHARYYRLLPRIPSYLLPPLLPRAALRYTEHMHAFARCGGATGALPRTYTLHLSIRAAASLRRDVTTLPPLLFASPPRYSRAFAPCAVSRVWLPGLEHAPTRCRQPLGLYAFARIAHGYRCSSLSAPRRASLVRHL